MPGPAMGAPVAATTRIQPPSKPTAITPDTLPQVPDGAPVLAPKALSIAGPETSTGLLVPGARPPSPVPSLMRLSQTPPSASKQAVKRQKTTEPRAGATRPAAVSNLLRALENRGTHAAPPQSLSQGCVPHETNPFGPFALIYNRVVAPRKSSVSAAPTQTPGRRTPPKIVNEAPSASHEPAVKPTPQSGHGVAPLAAAAERTPNTVPVAGRPKKPRRTDQDLSFYGSGDIDSSVSPQQTAVNGKATSGSKSGSDSSYTSAERQGRFSSRRKGM